MRRVRCRLKTKMQKKDEELDKAKRVVSTDSSQGLFHLEMEDESRGFILLDKHSGFVRVQETAEDVTQGDVLSTDPPSKEARKVNLVLLDTMLVATAQHNVNFRPNQADNEAADDDKEADNEAADDLATIQEDEQATIQEKESVPLKVIEASVLMPHDSLKVFCPKHAYEPYLIQITGDRYVSGQRRKRSYYLATYNADDCHQLVKVLESRKKQCETQ